MSVVGRRRGRGAVLVLLAAGQGTRVGRERNKVLLPLSGRPVLDWSLAASAEVADIDRTVLVLRDEDRGFVGNAVREYGVRHPIVMVRGGSTRHGSESQALRRLAPDIASGEVEIVVIHDAARPLATAALYQAVIDAARRDGGALPVLDQRFLLSVEGVPLPPRLVVVQTPQAFRAAPLLSAYEAADSAGFVGSDTASCMERYSDARLRAVPGDPRNIKITFPEDLRVAEHLLSGALQPR